MVDRKKKLWLSEKNARKKTNGGVPGQGGGRGRNSNQGHGRQGRGGRGGRGNNNNPPGKWGQPTTEEKEAASCENRKPRRIIKRGREQVDTLNEYLFESKRWIQVNMQSSEVVNLQSSGNKHSGEQPQATTNARNLVEQSINFNCSTLSDRDYLAHVSNMELAIS